MPVPSCARKTFDASDLVGAPVDVTNHGSGIIRRVVEKMAEPTATSTATDSRYGTARFLVELTEKGESSAPRDVSSDTPTQRSAFTSPLLLGIADLACYPVCSPGTPVLTILGTGVLVSFRPRDSIHVVRLWHPRGAGSALAYLNRAWLLRPLPAAVGVRAQTPRGHGIVVKFTSGVGDEDDTFDVKLAGGETVSVYGQSLSSPVSKVR